MSRLSSMNPFGPAALLGVAPYQGGQDEEERRRLMRGQPAAMPQIEQAPMPQPGPQQNDPGALLQALNNVAAGSPKAAAGGYPDASTEKPGGFNPDFMSTVTTASGTQAYPWFNKPGGPQQIGNPTFTSSGQGMDPIAPYLSALTGYGYGQSPMQFDPNLRAHALGAMQSDQDRAMKFALGQMQFGGGGFNQQKLDLERQQLQQHGDLAREQMANQLLMEREKKSPDALKASMMLGLAQRAAGDPTFDYERVPNIMGELDKMMGQFGTGLPNTLAGGPGSMRGGDARGFGGTAPVASPGQQPQVAGVPPVAPSPQQQVDRIIGQIRPALGSVAMGPGGKGGESFTPFTGEQMNPQKILDAVGRLQGFDLSDPAIQAELTRRVQRGDIGDTTLLRKMLAQQTGADYLLANPPPRDQGGSLPGSYSIPGLFEMREQKPGTFFGDLGRRFGRGMNADTMPYNKISLPTGELIDFSPRESGAGMRLPTGLDAVLAAAGTENPVASAINNRATRAEEAKRRLPTSQALLRALMNRAAASGQ